MTADPHPSSWREIPDAAGQSSNIAAKRAVKGSCHFFGQAVWPSRDGIAPFHGPLTLSDRGLEHYSGSFEPGRVELRDEADNPPPRGRRGVPAPRVPEHPEEQPGRRRATAAHRQTFDGDEVRSLLTGT